MNYMGTAEAVGLRSGDLLTAGVAANNLMMTLYFLLLFILPSIRSLRLRFHEPLPDRWWGTSIHLPSITGGARLERDDLRCGLLAEIAARLGRQRHPDSYRHRGGPHDRVPAPHGAA